MGNLETRRSLTVLIAWKLWKTEIANLDYLRITMDYGQ